MERFLEAVGVGAKQYVEIKPQHHQQNIYRYRVLSFERVQAVMAMLWPWLSPRRKDRYMECLARQMEWVAPVLAGAPDGRRGKWRRDFVDGVWVRTRVG